MPARFPATLAAAALALLAPAAASAAAFDASVRAGVAAPFGTRVDTGLTWGVGAGLGLGERYRLTLAADRSGHALSDGSGRIDIVTASAALELALDTLPVIPTIAFGPSYQYAWRPDTGASASVPGFQVALGLRAVAFEHLHVGAQVRYLTAAFNADTFPAFSTFVLELGWASR